MTALISNIAQSSNLIVNEQKALSQRLTIGSNAAAAEYTPTGVDVVSASSTAFTAQVCGTNASTGLPTTTCTNLTAPGTFAVGTMSFIAPGNTTLVKVELPR